MKSFFTFLVALAGWLDCKMASADDIAASIAAGSTNNVVPIIDTAVSNLSQQNSPSGIALPNIPEPAKSDASLLPTQNGSLQLKGSLDGNRFMIKQDFSSGKGAPIDIDIATQNIPATTVGWLVSSKPDRTESVLNMGWRLGDNQQLLFSTAQLRGIVDADIDGKNNLNLNQYTSGLNYRYFVNQKWLSGIEMSGYTSQSQSLTATMPEDMQQRIAGTNMVGVRLGLEAAPLATAKLHIGVGTERLSYDSLSGVEPIQNLNTSIKWSQIVMPTVKYSASVEGSSTERSVTTGLDFNLRSGQQLGVKLARTLSNDGQTAENAVQLSYTLQFGNKFTPFQAKSVTAPWNSSLVPEVLQRPTYLPKSVLSKPDSSLN